MRHKLYTGSFAWIIQRVSGVLLALFLTLHLYFMKNINGPLGYQSIAGMMKNPLIKFGETILLMVAAAHTLNGIRIVLLEAGAPTRFQKPLFYLAALGIVVLSITGAYSLLGGRI
ncbi:MAG: hypothetical protein HY957_07770 [Nitrospirae bacterium]|nr:hypothetical protein [Nitrospirota bacterium]